MAKIIFILIDGLSAREARGRMSWLEALRAASVATAGEATTVLPPLSKPVYATLLTGLDPLLHGVCRNEDRLAPGTRTLFSAARSAGLVTAAAAHAWFAELCNSQDFDPMAARLCYDPDLPLSHGLFYASDSYPDEELFADAEVLRQLCDPDLLLVHNMGVDFAAHQYGGASPEYRDAARRVDALLSRYIPVWRDAGYEILIMADHGADDEGRHYDAVPEVTRVPVWGVGDLWRSLPESPADAARMIAAGLGLVL